MGFRRKPVVVVTGASKGLGLAVTRLLLRSFGARVVALSRTQPPDLLALASDDLFIVPCDLSNESAVENALSQAKETFKYIDGLVLNAGVLEPLGRIGDITSISEWKRHFDVNFFSLVTTVKAALPELRTSELGGRVVFVSSGAAVKGQIGRGPYEAGKAAMNSLCSTLAEEEPGIVSLALRPGMVDTQMQELIRSNPGSALPDHELDIFMNAYKEGRLVDPEDAGHVIAALALRADPILSGQFIAWNSDACKAYRAN